ncbi:MAG: hypothetical protein M0R80_09705 [Proteobacteria bacterium]|nr:hypothetical protein [Pseudomonadota bacterium]
MQEMEDRKLYLYNVYAPFYICSYAMHHMNLLNRKIDIITGKREAVYWEAGDIPELREHNLFISPSGFMKTTYLRAFNSIFKSSGTDMVFKSGMTESALVGSVTTNRDGEQIPHFGIAEIHANDIIMIDEFTTITGSTRAVYNATLISRLLEILDGGHISKDLAAGGRTYDTFLTLWAGIQPSHYEGASGLFRRFCPLIFLPTRYDNTAMLQMKQQMSNIRENETNINSISTSVVNWKEKFNSIESIEFATEVYSLHQELNLFQFETNVFNNLLLGYHLAKYGPEPHIKVEAHDNEILRLIGLFRDWKRLLLDDIDSVMICKIIKSIVQRDKDSRLITSRRLIADECKMISWGRKDVFAKLKCIESDGDIRIVGDTVQWTGVQ